MPISHLENCASVTFLAFDIIMLSFIFARNRGMGYSKKIEMRKKLKANGKRFIPVQKKILLYYRPCPSKFSVSFKRES